MSDESFPVFRVKGTYQLDRPEKGGEVIGAVVQVAEDLFEAYYYGFKPGERSIGFADSPEKTIGLFYNARKRVEVDAYPKGLAANPSSIGRDRIGRGFGPKLKARVGKARHPRFRFCGSTQWCACHSRRFGGYFESQCQVCRQWSQFGVKYFRVVLDPDTGEVLAENFHAHEDCLDL